MILARRAAVWLRTDHGLAFLGGLAGGVPAGWLTMRAALGHHPHPRKAATR